VGDQENSNERHENFTLDSFKLTTFQKISHIFETKNDKYMTHDLWVCKNKIVITDTEWILNKRGEVQIFCNDSNKSIFFYKKLISNIFKEF